MAKTTGRQAILFGALLLVGLLMAAAIFGGLVLYRPATIDGMATPPDNEAAELTSTTSDRSLADADDPAAGGPTLAVTGDGVPEFNRVTVEPGDRVTWVNATGSTLVITADPARVGDPAVVTPEDAGFDSGEIPAGERWSHAFETPGEHRYVCLTDAGRGELAVVEVRPGG